MCKFCERGEVVSSKSDRPRVSVRLVGRRLARGRAVHGDVQARAHGDHARRNMTRPRISSRYLLLFAL